MTTGIQKDTSKTIGQSTRQVNYIRPYYEINEREDNYDVKVFFPGVNKDGVNISLEGDTLEITGMQTQKIPDTWKAILREQQLEDFRLQLQLNVKIDDGKIAAKIENGVLELNLPKSQGVKPKSIAVT